MVYSKITAKEVNGMIYQAMDTATGLDWVSAVSMESPSNNETEKYGWLGSLPVMREWKGPRIIKTLLEYDYSIKNKKYEATFEVEQDDLDRDKTGQLLARISQFASRAQSHWADLLVDLLVNYTSYTCYDGQYFFDTDHASGASGTLINYCAAAQIPALNITTTTAPTAAEAADIVLGMIAYMMTYKDDQGQPMNQDAKGFAFLLGTPSNYLAYKRAVTANFLSLGIDNLVPASGFNIQVFFEPRLSSLTTQPIMFRTDAPIKPLIRQTEKDIQVQYLGEDSDYAFANDALLYGLKAKRAVGYSFWQYAMMGVQS